MLGAVALPKISTGTDIVVASNRMMTTTGSGSPVSDVQPMSPMDTIREVFFEIRDSLALIAENTLKTANLLESTSPTPAEIRDDRINEGETDSQGNPPPADEGGPGFLDRLSALNPVKAFSGLGTFGKFLVAIGALVGLKLFGDKLVPSIASLLQTIKEGKITDKISEIYTDLSTTVLEKFEQLKAQIALVIEGVKDVIETVKGVYKSITDYIMTFDVDGDGVLDENEKKELQKDVTDKISNFIYDTIGETLLAIGSIFGLVTVAKIMSSIGTLKLAPAAAGLLGTAGAGLLGTAALVALAAAGIYRGYQNVQMALNDSIDKETGDLDNSKFVSKLIAGKNEEGGILNASINAFDKGLIGLSAGAIIGFLIGGPPGAIVGARIGSLAGTAIGAIAGYIGSESFDQTLTQMGDNFTTNMDNVSSFIRGVPSAYDADEEALTKDLKLMNEGLTTLKAQKAERESEGKSTGFIDKQIKKMEEMIEEQKLKIANVDVAFADRMSGGEVGEIDDQIKATNEFINEMKQQMLTGGQIIDTPGGQVTLDPPTQADLNAQLLLLEELKAKRRDLIKLYEKFEEGKLGDGNQIEFESDFYKNKSKEMSFNSGTSSGGNTTMANNNNNTLQSNIKGGDTVVAGGHSSDNPHFTALIMAHKKANMAN